jgi:hypothetical protein
MFLIVALCFFSLILIVQKTSPIPQAQGFPLWRARYRRSCAINFLSSGDRNARGR